MSLGRKEKDPLLNKDRPASDVPDYESMTDDQPQEPPAAPVDTPASPTSTNNNFVIAVTPPDAPSDPLPPADNPFGYQPVTTNTAAQPNPEDDQDAEPNGSSHAAEQEMKTPGNNDREAIKLLQDVYNQIRPWEGNSLKVSTAIALCGATSTALSTDHFANNLLHGTGGTGLRVAVDIAAAPPTFALSFNSNLAVWNHLIRTLPNSTFADFKRNALPVVFTALSAITSFKVNWDGLHDWSFGARLTFSCGRAISALGTNGLFATKQWKKWQGYDENSKPMQVVLDAHDKLLKLAREDEDTFITALSNSRLFENLCASDPNQEGSNPKNQVNDLFNSFFNLLSHQRSSTITAEAQIAPSQPSRFNKKNLEKAAGGFGAISGLMYFKYATSVLGELFQVATDNPLIIYGVGGLVFGLPSVSVNAAIGAISMADSASKMYDILANEGLKNHFSKYSQLDWILLPFKTYFIIGSSLAAGGMAFQRPIPDHEVAAWIEAGLNLFVQAAISSMSIEKFFTTLQNAHHRNLLATCKTQLEKGIPLKDHYNSLEEKNDRIILGRILLEYINGAIMPIKDFFNHSTPEINDAIFSEAIKAKLKSHVYSKAKAAPAVASSSVSSGTTAPHTEIPVKLSRRHDYLRADPAVATPYLSPSKKPDTSATGQFGLRRRTPRTTPHSGQQPDDVELRISPARPK